MAFYLGLGGKQAMKFKVWIFFVAFALMSPIESAFATCSFSCGAGTGTPPAPQENDNNILPQNTCTYSGHVFTGWLDPLSEEGIIGQPGEKAPVASCDQSRTLTAQWEATTPTPASPRNTVTSKSYVDSEFSQKQDIIPALGGQYAVIYGPSSGKLDWYQIDTSVTSSNTRLITAGAVVSSLNNKQNKISGTSGNVVTYTGSSGGVSSKPVYNSSGSYNANALAKIENVNDTVVNAFNAHVTCYEYATPGDSSSCILWNVNQLSGTYVPHN